MKALARRLPPSGLALLLLTLAAPACRRPPEVTDSQRRQAALLASEAQFALTLRNWTEAEGKLAQAAALDPEDGELWLALGGTRMRLGRREDARTAYKASLEALAAAAEKDPRSPDAALRQVHVLALLGRTSEARDLAGRLGRSFPSHRAVRAFLDGGAVDRMVADPRFKELAL